MAKIKEKEKALKLRKKGKSIKDIASNLNVSKSTVSYWCRDIVLSQEQIDRLTQQMKERGSRALFKVAQKKREERIKKEKREREKGFDSVKKIEERALFFLGLGLYWGEGYKESSKEFGFTNSDPQMLKVYLRWLRVLFGVHPEDLIARVSINHIHKKREKEIIQYWCNLLGLKKDQFTKTSFIKTRVQKKYSDDTSYFGTLRVKVRRGSLLKQRVIGALNACGYEPSDLF